MVHTTGSFGSGFADGVRYGKYQDAAYQYGVMGIRPSCIYTYEIIPQAASNTAVALGQPLAAAGYLTLTANNVATSSVTVQGQTAIALDYPRVLNATGVGGTTAANYFIYGLDFYNQVVVDEIVHGGGAVTVNGNKAFKYVFQVYSSAATGNNISIGITDYYGLPYLLNNYSDMIQSYSAGQPNFISGISGAMTAGTPSTILVNNIFVTSGDTILFQHTGGGVVANYGDLYPGAVVNNTSFIINSSSTTDTDLIRYTAPGLYSVLIGDQTLPATTLTDDVRGIFGVATPSNGDVTQAITYYVYGADAEWVVNNPAYIQAWLVANPGLSFNNQTHNKLFGVPQNKHGGPF